MEDILTCKFCYDVYEDPVLLSCGHSVCFACAEKMYIFKLSELLNPQAHSAKISKIVTSPTTSTTTSSSSSDILIKIPCPTCNVSTSIEGKNGVTTLKKNFDLIGIVQAHAAGKLCELECGRMASCECKNCQASLCEECFSLEHQSMLMKKHVKVEFGKNGISKLRDCAIHQERIVGFCTQCNVVICNTCTNFEDGHKGHKKCVTLAQYKQIALTQLGEIQRKMRDMKPKFEELQRQIEEELSQVEAQYIISIETIDTEISKLIASLENRRNHLIATAGSLKDLKQSELKTQRKGITLARSDVDSVLETISITSTADPVELGVALQAALRHYQYLESQSVKPCCRADMQTTIDSKSLLNVINKLGSICSISAPAKMTNTPRANAQGVSFELEWDPPTSDCAILGYQIQLKKDQAVHEYESATNKLSLTNLAFGHYNGNIRALNVAGAGEWLAFTLKYEAKTHTLTHTAPFDKNGVMYFFGTDYHTTKYTNPAFGELVEITKSPLDSGDPRDVDGYSATGSNYTGAASEACYVISFKRYSLIPNYYSLKSDNSVSYKLRNWVLQGQEGASWTTLKNHKKDTALAGAAGSSASWPLPNITKAYKTFRVMITGPNSANTLHLALGGIEFYGKLIPNA